MNNIFKTAIFSGIIAVAGMGNVLAQEGDEPSVFPMETFTCNYKEGKDADDIAKVNKKWNAWTDKSAVPEYAAWMIEPYFVSGDIEFDLGWIGGWPDGNAMGKSLQEWADKGSELSAAYGEVLDCNSHSNFAAMVIKPAEAINDTSLVAFSDCKVAEGHTMDQTVMALSEWGQYLAETGHDGGAVILFPAFGVGDIDYDFKWMRTYDSFETFGKAYEQFGNGGGYQKSSAMLDGLMSCDVSRLYTVEVVRNVPEN